MLMAFSAFFLVLLSCFHACSLSSLALDTLKQGSSLSVEKPDNVLVSNNGVFSAGFFNVGDNAFCFAIWITKSKAPTVVWMANRDQPVNGRRSKLSLLKTGILVLKDAGQIIVWTTDTTSLSPVQLRLLDTGNLVLHTQEGNVILWQSFGSPTDTLLADQLLTRNTNLISSRSQTNYSSGPYKLYFDNDDVLHLLFERPDVSSRYWPYPWMDIFQAGRTSYNNSRFAVFNATGYFTSSDDLKFCSLDCGAESLRRLTLDPDGNLRLYSLHETNGSWEMSWQAISRPCQIHGICGPNSICRYDHKIGRGCSCLPGYKIKDSNDWSSGCRAETELSSCKLNRGFSFVKLTRIELYGYDHGYFPNVTLQECKERCLNLCNCNCFQYKFDGDKYSYACYPKTLLLNGHRSPGFDGDLYLKLPKVSALSSNIPDKVSSLDCKGEILQRINRTYTKSPANGSLKFMIWFATAFGGLEMIFIVIGCCFVVKADKDNEVAMQGYLFAATGFKRYTYAELKKATRGFAEEIGRGGGGIVYKGELSDQRVAAVKCLNEANQGEAEFLAEVSTIGKLNHKNLIEMWGYCAEGKHRVLVYEFMENGSLADNLSSNSLSWEKKVEIALGTAKGLSYLHEECLEWILHCDIKPQNILLDSDFQPKVSDFGLAKLLNRGGLNDSSFSRIRGTRGYMAPEWIYNLTITSKVDVYSYGIVVLEMLTGRSPAAVQNFDDPGGLTENPGGLNMRLVTWVREKISGAATRESWMEEILDPMIGADYDKDKMEILVKVALQCAEEDKDGRPTMKQVVQMLLGHKDEVTR